MQAFAFLALLLVGSAAAQENHYSVFEGTYVVWFEVSRFTPKDTHEAWWLSGKVPCLDKFTKVGDEDSEPLYLHLEVRGTLSPEGHYGHLGGYSRELEVTEVLSCRRATHDEAK